jgi:hypothetical protein
VTTVKRISDLTKYASVLPYASEMFGVYQPLLGWKSARIEQRFDAGLQTDKRSLLDGLRRNFAPVTTVSYDENAGVTVRVSPGVVKGGTLRSFDSVVLREIGSRLPPYGQYEPSIWSSLINEDSLRTILDGPVAESYTRAYAQLPKLVAPLISDARRALGTAPRDAAALERAVFERQLQYESATAATLLFLQQTGGTKTLESLFYSTIDHANRAEALARILGSDDSRQAYFGIDSLDASDQAELEGVVLSPISVVHLFRQYFFELDTFLGPPESHVWLSPGSTVELIEVHTRSSTVEHQLETALDITTQSERTTTTQDELSEAVKRDNDQDIKFGASVTASYASINATSSFDYANSQKLARETTHRQMRQQTDKLSSQIRRNFKSTFKTITELTDISSTKHVLANTTDTLINYEIRRKMRQVGVQVQDIGTYLCWQTYVDDPGHALGISELIHIAKPAELDAIPHPEEIPLLEPIAEEKMVTIPFISIDDTGADNEGEVYVDGVESNDFEWFGNLEKIQSDFQEAFVSPRACYQLTNVEFDSDGKPVTVSRRGPITNSSGQASFTLHLDSADFQGQNSVQVKLVLHWAPDASANDAITHKNADNVAAFKAAERAAYEKAYVETLKDRVTLASKIRERNGEDLRDEERIVVYRALIQDLLLNGVPLPDDRTRHVVSELLNAIFDVDKMLYFVAPEWWRPRLHRSRQPLPEKPEVVVDPAPPIAGSGDEAIHTGLMARFRATMMGTAPTIIDSSTVAWGGANDPNRDNYYITDESDPAKLGSSLGWLLQLDGDNMRNAFLNAPWVKAVIPVRPGKEAAAINWLKHVEGMNGITDDVIYHSTDPNERDLNGSPLDGQKIIDVLLDLAEKIKQKHSQSLLPGEYPHANDVSDPALVNDETTVTATPIDRVYEHGFFPLKGGFRADVTSNYEVFDQWIEVLPTDQSVPVAVVYDPKTGRQLEQ